jgi:integrase
MRTVNSNPCKLVQRTRESARRRHMLADEAPKIAAALRRHEPTAAASVAFIWLLILSGARCGEIAAARWEWIEGNVLRLPDSKTGARTLFLPSQVMELLARLPRKCETITGIKEPVTIWKKVRAEAGCPDLRLHDLRRSFASAALSAGVSLSQIGELLGHRNAQTTRRYAYLMSESATAAATVAADRITALMRG